MPKTEKLALEIEVKKIGKGLEQVQGEIRKLAGTHSRQTGTMLKHARTLDAGFQKIKGSVLNLKTAIIALAGAAGIGLLARSFVDVSAGFERMQLALDTITKGRGEEWFERINEWALKMPINTEKAIETFMRLRGAGLPFDIREMQILVDTTGALGGEGGTLEGIARALGQIYTKGKVSVEELQQLAERNVPAYEILRQKLNLTGAEVAEIGKLGIDGATAVNALMEGMDERFGGMSAKLQQSWSGLVTTIKSFYAEFQRLVMKSGPMEAMKAALRAFAEQLDQAKKTGDLDRWAYKTAIGVIDAFEIMGAAAHAFGQTVLAVQGGFASVVGVVEKAHTALLEREKKHLERFLEDPSLADKASKFIAALGGTDQAAKARVRLEDINQELVDAKVNVAAAEMATEAWVARSMDLESFYDRAKTKLDEWRAASEQGVQSAGQAAEKALTSAYKFFTGTKTGAENTTQALTGVESKFENIITRAGEDIKLEIDTSGALKDLDAVLKQIRAVQGAAKEKIETEFVATMESSPKKPFSEGVAYISDSLRLLQAEFAAMGVNFNMADFTPAMLSAIQPLRETARELQRVQALYHHTAQMTAWTASWTPVNFFEQARSSPGYSAGMVGTNVYQALQNAQQAFEWQKLTFMSEAMSAAGGTAGRGGAGVTINIGTINALGGSGDVAREIEEAIRDNILHDRSPIIGALEQEGYI